MENHQRSPLNTPAAVLEFQRDYCDRNIEFEEIEIGH